MKKVHFHCRNCKAVVDNDEDMKRGLCSRCYKSGIKNVKAKFREEDRSSFMDDYLDPLGLENLGE